MIETVRVDDHRFRSSAQQTQILKDLKEGKIDILIGTHRLVSKDVVWKELDASEDLAPASAVHLWRPAPSGAQLSFGDTSLLLGWIRVPISAHRRASSRRTIAARAIRSRSSDASCA